MLRRGKLTWLRLLGTAPPARFVAMRRNVSHPAGIMVPWTAIPGRMPTRRISCSPTVLLAQTSCSPHIERSYVQPIRQPVESHAVMAAPGPQVNL